MLIVAALTLFICVVMGLNPVSVSYGVVEVIDGKVCNITANGTTLEIQGTMPGLQYGLIQYQCGKDIGQLLSKPRCMDCGIYCPYNDMLLECQAFWTPFVLGSFFCALIVLLLSFLYCRFAHDVVIDARYRLLNHRRTRRVNRFRKTMRHINLDTIRGGGDGPIPSAPQDPPELPPRNPPPAYLEMLPRDGVVAIAADIYSDPRFCPLDKPERRKPQVYPDLTCESLPAGVKISTLAQVLIVLACIGVNKACDQTLFLTSSGMVCDNLSCQDLKTYSFNFHSENLICFKTMDNDMIKYKMANHHIVYKYYEMYYTYDFTMSVNHTYNCKHAGYCDAENCKMGSSHPDFPNTTALHIDSCDADGLSCDTTCLHEYACTWYRVGITKTGPRARVFKLESSVWEFDLIMTKGTTTRTYKFTTTKPSNDIDSHGLYSNISIPMSVHSIDYPRYHYENNVLIYDNIVYEVDACSTNFPIGGLIGDYQESLNEQTFKYDMDSIKCIVTGCTPHCKAKESGLKVMLKTKNIRKAKTFDFPGLYRVNIYKDVKMNAQLMIGNIDFKNLYVEAPDCEITTVMSFRCFGCNQQPYIVFQSYNIHHEGIISFESNCTFDRQYLSCQTTLYQLDLVSDSKYCRIFVPTMNKTIDVVIESTFLGALSEYNPYIVSGNPLGTIKALVNNPNFINGITYGFIAYSGIGCVSVIAAKIIGRFLAIRKTEKVIETKE